jgi:hypothetical protein
MDLWYNFDDYGTMTVKELIDTLMQYPPDMKVLTTYETVFRGLTTGLFSIQDVECGKNEFTKTLVIDTE